MISRKYYGLALILFVVTFLVLYLQDSVYVQQPPFLRSRQILGTQFIAEPNSAEIFDELTVPVENLQLKDHVENLPDAYLNPALKYKKDKVFPGNDSCGQAPELFDIQFTNDHWQTQETSNGTYQLLNAFLDDRTQIPVVRIVGMLNRVEPVLKMYCKFWYNTSIPTPAQSIEAESHFYIWVKAWGGYTQGIYQPYLITCPLPADIREPPAAVSLVENPCTMDTKFTTNILRVIQTKAEHKKNFVVCVKGLDFPYDDNTVRLTEWIELLNILGAEKINFYEFNVHPNVKKLLNYYESQGKVEVTPLTLVGPYGNHPFLQKQFLSKKLIHRRLQEVIPYNDCFYRHMNEYRYVVLLDTDEVIVPVAGDWIELLDGLEKESKGKTGAYAARNVYFLDQVEHKHDWFKGIPRYMHMLQHVDRTRNYTKPGHFIKAFHDTDQVVALHNHFPKQCLLKGCNTKNIDVSLAHLQHYRKDCVKEVSNCAEMRADSVMDTRVWHYKDELIQRVQKTFRDLGFLRD